MDEELVKILIASIGFAAGLFVGAVMAASRSREARRLIAEIKEWAARQRPERNREDIGYNDARMDIRLKIEAFETEQ